jgi:sulfur carrier protein
MNVTVNGEARDVVDGTTVAALVGDLGCGPRGTAVAVNHEVVPRSTWGETRLRPGDRVEVLVASQGG